MSSSRKSALAGAVAGLLLAGIGAWYASNHKIHATATPMAAAPAPVAMPAAKANVSRDQAVEKLMALPELKRLADAIEKRSGGERHGALLETDPAPRDVNGSPYYQLIFVENGDDMAQAVASFLVSHVNGDILVEDDISGELMSLDQWRKGLKD
ncbi:hypothetical protein ACN9MZ_24260 [Pseudoduganella sp. S-14]|jgi:hypothetical protein|uniref:hypothetical protein n=1 Tax=Pseudoduganella sp. S-14 TaxID=3404065 RepID=UPI003CF2772D